MDYDDLLKLSELLQKYMYYEVMYNNPLEWLRTGAPKYDRDDFGNIDLVVSKMKSTRDCLEHVLDTIKNIEDDE